MATLLIKNIHTLVTMNRDRQEIRQGALLIRDHVIEQVGTTADLVDQADQADEVLDLGDRHIVLPGLINTHHHFYQSLTRTIPAVQDSELFGWLQGLYPLWANLTAADIRISAQLCAAELMLSGCTTASDHLYLFPNDCTLDDEIEAIQEMGLRFHASRGSMSVGESLGGLPPDSLVEKEPAILSDSQRLIEQYHDSSRYAMVRVVLAPCSPFSVSQDLMRESAALARAYGGAGGSSGIGSGGVRLHTHLAEDPNDVTYSLEKFGLTPGDYAESVGWLGEDVWHAHCVQLSDQSIEKFARSGTGVAHCPCSNCRLASGIAPVRKMLDQGVAVGLGVDGAASNDATHLLSEARMAFLLARVREGNAAAITARQALELATVGGAKVLGRDDVGVLAPGMAADLIGFNLDQPTFVGAQDPVAALIFCQPPQVDYSFIHGRKVIERGQFSQIDLPKLVWESQRAAAALWAKA
ncbi:MAG: 8-oxoguanine deaminase [Synechococcales cyanobacterium RM1_1_8]|nr:8-oxoguanine deaminase [Synechococcales cyanobacterium RM1_1_8]